MEPQQYSLQEQIERLNRIGIALTLEHDLQKLLELIVSETRALTRADGGSLYLVHDGRLRFTVAQNDTMDERMGGRQVVQQSFKQFDIEITRSSLAGYVATTGQPLNIPDVYQLPPEAEYCFSRKFDEQNQYRTKSMLLVPMRDKDSQIAGVLCLINATDPAGNVIPFSREYESLLSSVASQAMAAVENVRLIDKLKYAYLDTIFCLSMAAEQKDEDTGEHVRRISEYSGILGRRLGLDDAEVERIRYASPLHDVGKIGIPDRILKKPGKLTDEEYQTMKQHTVIGAEILKGDSEYLAAGRKIALTHHEKYNGTGYPYGLKGEAIHLYGRIVAVVDVFDALVSKRVYKDAMDPEDARRLILQESGEHFCPDCVGAFDGCFENLLEARVRLTDESEVHSPIPGETGAFKSIQLSDL